MFEKLIGNDELKEYFEKSIKSNNISHSYMFTGTSGVGKKQFAKEFAKYNLCLEDGHCDDKCDSCIKFNGNNNPDFSIIKPDGNTIKISQIREMQEDIAKKPIVSNKKIYIIDDADKMSEESQNCLLKTLEEPPEYAIIILIVANESRMLATIKSRCVILKFKKLSNEEIKRIIPNLTEEQIYILDGSLEKIEDIQEKTEQFKQIENVVQKIKNGSLVDVLNSADVFYNGKDNINELLDFTNIIFFKNGMYDTVEIVEETKNKIRYNNNYEMCIDYLLINSFKAFNK